MNKYVYDIIGINPNTGVVETYGREYNWQQACQMQDKAASEGWTSLCMDAGPNEG